MTHLRIVSDSLATQNFRRSRVNMSHVINHGYLLTCFASEVAAASLQGHGRGSYPETTQRNPT